MRVRLVTTAMIGGLLALAGCAQRPVEQAAAAPPNPFGYLRPAASCSTRPLQLPASGAVTSTMTVGNDGGYCALRVTGPDGGAFASFVVATAPNDGLPFLYNYNNGSVITYTPKPGYTGSDAMTVELVSGPARPRAVLHLNVTVTRGVHPTA